MSKSLNDSSPQFAISVRMERPIEGCELTPYAFITVKGNSIDNIAKAKLLEATPHSFVCKWYRGPQVSLCCNENCKRANNYDATAWTKHQLKECSIRCAICERAGLRKDGTMFCTNR